MNDALIPIVLCIDVEPDARTVDTDHPPAWRGFPATWEAIEAVRPRLSRAGHSARVNWFLRMDPQVEQAHGSASWVAEAHGSIMKGIGRAADGVGLHTHAWRRHASQGWVSDFSSADWIDECLEMSFRAFGDALGTPCTLFRLGDRWMDQRTMVELERRGIEVDLTPEPGFDPRSFYTPSEVALGVLPDYTNLPTGPYRPSLDDFAVEDPSRHSRLWILPVSTAAVQPMWPHRMYNRWVVGRPVTDMSTAMLSLPGSAFRGIVDQVLRRPRPHLVATLRSGAAVIPRYAARIARNVAMLVDHPQAERFVWVTPVEALQLLRE